MSRALGYGCRIAGDTVVLGGLDKNAIKMLNIHHLTLTGTGSSLLAAQYGAKLMAHLGSFDSAHAVNCTDFNEACVPTNHGGVCVISKTGDSRVSNHEADRKLIKSLFIN